MMREAHTEQHDDDPRTFRCRYCGATERYDPPELSLLLWWQASELFRAKHRGCAEQQGAAGSVSR